MNNLSKEETIKKLLEYRDILQDAYDKESKKESYLFEIRKHKESIEREEKLLEQFIEDKEKNIGAIEENTKAYRRNVLIHYILYALFSFPLIALIKLVILGFEFKIKYDSTATIASTLIGFIIFVMMSLYFNFKIKTEEKTNWKEKTLCVKGYEKRTDNTNLLGILLLMLYIVGSSSLGFLLIEGLVKGSAIPESAISFFYDYGISTLIMFPIFFLVLFILTSSKRRFGNYKQGWENAEKVVREIIAKNIAYNQQELNASESALQNLGQEYDEIINQSLYIEAVNFLPDIDVWQASSYNQSINRLNNLTMVIYYMRKNYVDTYGEALRYLETVKAQEGLRRETEQAKWTAEAAIREANEARNQADMARIEADMARIEADNARFRADQARLQADQARYNSW